MTHKHAETTANVILIAAGAAAAFFVLRDPKLRRLTWRLAKQYASGPLAVWGGALIRESWAEAGRSRRIV